MTGIPGKRQLLILPFFFFSYILLYIESSDLSHASVKASYLSPTPPKGSGDHRYLFLLYKQPNATVTFEPLQSKRGHWDYTDYVKHLELVGANFFLSRNELD
jgi:hypothetical protein